MKSKLILLKNCIKKRFIGKFRMVGTKGQSTIEFVLLIPFLIIVILSVSQLGYMVYIQNVIQQAARESIRIVSTTNSNHKAYEKINKICSKLDKDKLEIRITPESKMERKVGDYVSVDIAYRYGGISNFIKNFTGKEIIISSNSSMRMECY